MHSCGFWGMELLGIAFIEFAPLPAVLTLEPYLQRVEKELIRKKTAAKPLADGVPTAGVRVEGSPLLGGQP